MGETKLPPSRTMIMIPRHRPCIFSLAMLVMSTFMWGTVVAFCSQSIRTNTYAMVSSKTVLYDGDKKKNLSASERERRDEERRRRERKEDVVIGKTSAKKGAKDFALDPKGTEQEYLRQASIIEREVHLLTTAGMESFNSLQLDKADSAFSQVFVLKPEAYLWQAGIVKFYLDDIEGAGRIFSRAAETYESRFGSPASEERIWRDACELKYLETSSRNRRKDVKDEEDRLSAVIPPIKEMESSDDFLSLESRRIFRLVRDLFSSAVLGDKSSELLARAKLRSIAGSDKSPRMDPKKWTLHSWYFLGLYHDCIGDRDESKKCMKMALKLNPSSGKSDDIFHTLPLLHMTVRDWFDDDEFDSDIVFGKETDSEKDSSTPTPPSPTVPGMAYADPLIEKSIKEGVTKLKYRELKDALRLRGKITTGSKEDLQERLFFSLMDDAGFASGFAP